MLSPPNTAALRCSVLLLLLQLLVNQVINCSPFCSPIDVSALVQLLNGFQADSLLGDEQTLIAHIHNQRKTVRRTVNISGFWLVRFPVLLSSLRNLLAPCPLITGAWMHHVAGSLPQYTQTLPHGSGADGSDS